MVVRIILAILMIALAAGFIFFAGSVIWLGTREFFRIYGPKSKKAAAPVAPTSTSTPSVP